MINVKLNADLGEGANIEKLIMPFLSSCSIACGGHTGDVNSMSEAVKIAVEHNVKIGAHPSYPDKDGFGRIPINISNKDLSKSLISQINSLNQILNDFKINLDHIKPHGALYNLSAKNYDLAMLIIEVVTQNYDGVYLYVPSGSLIEKLALENNVKIKKEVFLDRNYNSDNSLVSRDNENAIIKSSKLMFDRIENLTKNGFLLSVSGKKINLQADTFCIHGDSPNIVDYLNGLNDLCDGKI